MDPTEGPIRPFTYGFMDEIRLVVESVIMLVNLVMSDRM